jgi:hypothetical protein
MNKLTCRKPTNIVITDAYCPGGIGGLSINSGKAWRVQISKSNIPTSNNNHEFLAAVVGIWVAAINNEIEDKGVVLSLCDNSSAIRWLHNCNCDKRKNAIRTEIAHKLATIATTYNFIIHPQHVKGEENKAADALSRRFDLNTNELTQFLHSNTTQQIPQNFEIFDLPTEITSWIFSVRVLGPSSITQIRQHILTASNDHGRDGCNSLKMQTSKQMNSSTHFKQQRNGKSEDASSKQHEKDTTVKEDIEMPWYIKVKNSFSEGLYKRPLAAWLRNSGITGGNHPSTKKSTQTSSLLTFTN